MYSKLNGDFIEPEFVVLSEAIGHLDLKLDEITLSIDQCNKNAMDAESLRLFGRGEYFI
jgi:hypothetical protein